MANIQVNQLSFAYPGSFDNVFKNVNFSIDSTWKLGFIARNGRGKTTFMRLLTGDYSYHGNIRTSVSFEYFPYVLNHPDYYVIDALTEQFPEIATWQIKRELSLMGFGDDIDYRVFNSLSYGEQTKIMLAVLFAKESAFLLIDEPTNHLDREGRDSVASYLASKSGFILVSHDRAFLDRCIDHVLVINKATIDTQKGNFSSWYQNKRYQDQFECNQNSKLKRQIDDLNQAAKRTAQWSDAVEETKIGYGPCDRGAVGKKAAKLMKRAKATEARVLRLASEKEKLLKNIEPHFALKIHSLDYHKERLVDAEHLQMRYDDTVVNQPTSFVINRADRVALVGVNGAGKTTLLKVLLEQHQSYDGVLRKGSQLTISYVPQGTDHLTGNLRDYCLHFVLDEGLFKSILHKMDFKTVQFDKPLENFSAGQKKKVMLARSLCQKAHLYIWDEPLNYIDVFSRIQLEEVLLNYQLTIIFIEHDQSFVDKVATKTIKLQSLLMG